MAFSSLGSATCTTWNRRVSAGSFSMCFLYSAQVVAAIVRSVPRASAGFSRLAASPGAGRAAGADQRVRFVDEQDDRLRRRLHFVDHLAQAVLELALHAGAGLQQPDVEREQRDVLQRRRHVAAREPQRKAFDDGGLADAGFTGENRIVLPPAHEDVDDLPDLLVAAGDRIDLPLARAIGEVGGVFLQRLLLAHLRPAPWRRSPRRARPSTIRRWPTARPPAIP